MSMKAIPRAVSDLKLEVLRKIGFTSRTLQVDATHMLAIFTEVLRISTTPLVASGTETNNNSKMVKFVNNKIIVSK